MNPTPSINNNYLWIPETSDNVDPGLDSRITYIQPKCATLTAVQNNVTHMNSIMQIEINNLEINNQWHLDANKQLNYHKLQTIPFNGITQYVNKATVEHILYRIISSHTNEKVTTSYKFNY